MSTVQTVEPVPGHVDTLEVMTGRTAASRARPGTCLLLVLTGGASSGFARADDIRGFREMA